MKESKMLRGYIFVIISAFLFGCMPLITTHINREVISRETVVLLRSALSLPALAILAWRQQKSFRIPLKSLPMIILIAIFGCCVTPLLLYKAYGFIQSGTATVFHFIYPAVVVVMGIIFLRQKPVWGTLVAVLLCVVGICMFYNPAEPLDWTGCILALVSGVTYATYIILLSVFKNKEVSGFKLSFYIALICALAMLVYCLITDTLTLPTSLKDWLLCGVLALVINVGAVVLFQQGTFLVGGERASILSTVEPMTGVVIGAIFLGEFAGRGARDIIFTVIGSALVILASILIAVFDMRRAKEA